MVARERHHSTAGRRRSTSLNSPVFHRQADAPGPGGPQNHDRRHDGTAGGRREGPHEHHHFGWTGAGKTTLLNALSAFISAKERIVTIEDAAELQLKQPHVVRLETRPPNLEGQGAVRQRELLINSLRMRRTASWWARCAEARRWTCCRP
jgi:hypothetical protein